MRFSKLITIVMLLGLVACGRKRESPTFTYMPDMAYSPSIKAGEIGSMKNPVEGTVHQTQEVYEFPLDPEAAAKKLENPIRKSEAALKVGQGLYNSYCAVCHGIKGQGDGPVVPPMTMPPSLTSKKISDEWSDGRIFHVITMGQGNMSSYKHALNTKERWMVINYIRAIQRSQNPSKQDLEKAESWE